MFKLFAISFIFVVFLFENATTEFASDNSTSLFGRIFNWQQISTSLLDFLVFKKNLLTAWPLEVATTAVDTLCSATLLISRVPPQVTPDIRKMYFQYMTPCENFSVPLQEAEKLWAHPSFNKSRRVVILATGWTNTVNASGAIEILSRAFLCRQDVNFVVVDAASYVDTLYKWAALNTDPIGEHIAVGLTRLIQITPLKNIHLVGHSLGAHVMGTAGRIFTKLTGLLVPRITGLDPAKPCFHKNQTLSGLFRTDAALVDVIHTNAGVLAMRGPLGDIDFYPGSINPLQPGCLTLGCSHRRAVEYFAESAYPDQEHNFLGFQCNSWDALKQQNCDPSSTSTMGYLINTTQRGIFHVDVHRSSPYGKFALPQSSSIQTRTCHVCS